MMSDERDLYPRLPGEPEDFTPAYDALLAHAAEIAEAVRSADTGQCVSAEAHADGSWHGVRVISQEERNDPDQPLLLNGVMMFWTVDPAITITDVQTRIRSLAGPVSVRR